MSDYPKTVLAVLIALMMTASGLSVVFAHGQSADASDSDNAKYNDYTDDLSIFDLLDQLGDFDPFSWDFEYSIRIFSGDETIEVFDPTVEGAAMVAGHTYILKDGVTYSGEIIIPQGQELILLLNQQMELSGVTFKMAAPADGGADTSLITAYGTYDATAKTLKGVGIDYSPGVEANIEMTGTFKVIHDEAINAWTTSFENGENDAVISITEDPSSTTDKNVTTITFSDGFVASFAMDFKIDTTGIKIQLSLSIEMASMNIQSDWLGNLEIDVQSNISATFSASVTPNADGTYDVAFETKSLNETFYLLVSSITDDTTYFMFTSNGSGSISANAKGITLTSIDDIMEQILNNLTVNIEVHSEVDAHIDIESDGKLITGLYIQDLKNDLTIKTSDGSDKELVITSKTSLGPSGYLATYYNGDYFGTDSLVHVDTITYSGAEGVDITSVTLTQIGYKDDLAKDWTPWLNVYSTTHISGDMDVEYDADAHTVGFTMDLDVDHDFKAIDQTGMEFNVDSEITGNLSLSSEFTVSKDMDPEDALEEIFENLVLDSDLESSLDVYINVKELGLEIIIDNFYADLTIESDEDSDAVYTYSEISVDEVTVNMMGYTLFSIKDLSDTESITVTYDSLEVTDSLEATIYDNEEDEWFTVAAYDDASITFDFDYDPETNAVDFNGDFSFYSYTYLDNQEFTAIEIENGLYEAHFDADDDINDYFTASMDASVSIAGVEIDFEDMEFDYKYVSELGTEVIYVGVPNITVDGDIVPTEYESVDEYLAGLVSVDGEVKDLSATFYLDDEDQFIPDEWTIGSAWFATSHMDGAYAEYKFTVAKNPYKMTVDIDVTGVVDVPEPIETFVEYADAINVKGDGTLLVSTLDDPSVVTSGILYVGCTQYHVDEDGDITLLEYLSIEGYDATLIGCAIGQDASTASTGKYFLTYLPGFENKLEDDQYYGFEIAADGKTVTITAGAGESLIWAEVDAKEYNLTINNEDGSQFYQGKVAYLSPFKTDETHKMPTGALWLVDSDGVVWGEIDKDGYWSMIYSAYKDLTLTIVTGDKIDAPTTTDFVKVNSEKFYMEIPQKALDSYNFEHTPTGLKFTFTVDGVFIDPGDVIKMTASKTKYNGYTAFDLHSSVPVTVTFTAKEGEKLWHVVDGKAVEMDGKVVDGTITVTLFDFSTYFVQKDPNHSPSNNSMLYIGIAIAAILVVAAIAAALYSKKKNAAA